jgi:hypothetical protein
MKDFKISFALSDSEYLTAVRLVVGAICSAAEQDIDATEDFKVCVTESCIILNNCGNERAEITFKTQDGVSAEVKGCGGKLQEGDNEFSLALISALVSSCEIEKDGQAITKVVLKI